jgi:hypothetical protein
MSEAAAQVTVTDVMRARITDGASRLSVGDGRVLGLR